MTAEELTALCWWYLRHVHYILIPAAVFDLICWAIILTKRQQILAWLRGRSSETQPQ